MESVYIITYGSCGSDYGEAAVVPEENVYFFYETAFKRLVELNTPLVDPGVDVVKFCEQMTKRECPFTGYYGLSKCDLNTSLEGADDNVHFGLMTAWKDEDGGYDFADVDWCDSVDDVIWEATRSLEGYLEMHEEEEDEEEDEEEEDE